jgi:TctA family transporter
VTRPISAACLTVAALLLLSPLLPRLRAQREVLAKEE